MTWSAAIDTIVESGQPILRSFVLEWQNGYNKGGDWTSIPLKQNGFTSSITEGTISISTLRSDIAVQDFTYFDEFDHTNPFQLASAVRLKVIIYLNSSAVLGGTVTFVAGNRRIVGAGTAFLTDLEVGDLIFSPINPSEKLLVYEIIDNLNVDVVAPPNFSGGPGAVIERVDAEREFYFRGISQDRQEEGFTQLMEVFDPLFKLNHCLSPLNEEADLVAGSPFADSLLRQAPGYDTPPEVFHFEIDPTAPGQAWAENPDGINRAFQPGTFIVEEFIAAAWENVPAEEYEISEPLGLITFMNDQGPVPNLFRLVEVSVYQEGTLEFEDIIETILRRVGTCPELGFGAINTQLEISCTGTITFVAGGPPYLVTGVGTLFLTELEVGDRISHVGGVGPYGIVDTIVNNFNLTIRYQYGGPTGVPGAFYKSTLTASYVSISKVQWRECQGYASDLIREMQRLYADFRGYRIWYDGMEDWIVGRAIAIDIPNAIELGPSLKGALPIHSTLEEFYTAVAVRGEVGRNLNLMTQPGVTITEMLTANAFTFGAANGGITSWGGMNWGLLLGAEYYINDNEMSTAFMGWRFINGWDETDYWPLVEIDLTAIYDLSTIVIYMPNCKNKNQWEYGLTLMRAVNPAGPWVPITPETYQVSAPANEALEFDVSGVSARYLRVYIKPIKWVTDGGARTIGIREIQVFGSEEFCEIVCIQNTDPAGGRYVGGDPLNFISDYYPNLMSKVAHIGHLVQIDDSGLVMTEDMARDRAYILLNEYIRLYRTVNWTGGFDPRVKLYDTVHAINAYRAGVPEDLYFLVQSLALQDANTVISGTEYGAGVLE